MVYLGNKYKLLDQIIPLFPSNINRFYDVFCGGLDVSLNVDANTVIANDKHSDLISLYREIQKYNGDLGDELLHLDRKVFPMNEFNGKALRSYNNSKTKETWRKLMEEKRVIYYKIRKNYNKSSDKDFKILLLLMLNGVGNVEFRVVNGYTTFTCGNLRVNENSRKSLNQFGEKINGVTLSDKDFRELYKIDFKKDDFVYLDPPYIGTSQYKMRWTMKDEVDLYRLLDYLDQNGVKFALSNFADGVNHTNEYLAKWCSDFNIHNLSDKHSNLIGISNKGERREVLITNY